MVEIANDFQVERIGIHITIAGLSLQVASLALLFLGCVDFVRRCRRKKGEGLSRGEIHERIRRGRLFKLFLGGESRYIERVRLVADLREVFFLLQLLYSYARFTEFLSCKEVSMVNFGTAKWISVSFI